MNKSLILIKNYTFDSTFYTFFLELIIFFIYFASNLNEK